MISFIIYGDPIAKGRARVTKKGYAYTPQKTQVAEQSFQYQSLKHRPDKPLNGPIFIDLVFYRSIPRSFSKKKRTLAILEAIIPTTRPDLDNLTKLVKDAMNGIFYIDDSQVVGMKCEKFYSETPRIEVKLLEVKKSEKNC